MHNNAGDGIATKRSGWSFAGDVADSFDKHVSKSVPLYEEGHRLICALTDFFLRKDSVVYDMGCSTGELTLKLASFNREAKPYVRYYGLDVEKKMIDKAIRKNREIGMSNVSFEVSDILSYEYEPCDMIIAYYTMQFVPPKVRQVLVDTIFEKLNWGGAFVMFEKVRGADARFQDILTAMYNDYKLDQGYSQEEVMAKSMSLRGVLEPFSTYGNRTMLERAGFKDIQTIFRYICFQGFLAIK